MEQAEGERRCIEVGEAVVACHAELMEYLNELEPEREPAHQGVVPWKNVPPDHDAEREPGGQVQVWSHRHCPDERFGLQRLRELLAEHSGVSPGELLEALDMALEQFREGQAADDVAALALRAVPYQR